MSIAFVSPGRAQVSLGPEFQVNTYTAGNQCSAAAAGLPNGGFVVVWASDGQDGDSGGIFSQRFASDGSRIGQEFQVNTATADDQTYPDVASDSTGQFVVVWQSYEYRVGGVGYSLSHVTGQRFSSSGARLGTEFRVNARNDEDQIDPAVAKAANGDFAVVWQSYDRDGSGSGIFAQRFASGGARLGVDFQVNRFTADDQTAPDVAPAANGGFVVVWQSYQQDGSDQGVFAQRWSSSGGLVGTEFRVANETAYAQGEPAVVSDGAGNFVVAWKSDAPDPGPAIAVKRYSSSGAAIGTEFRVDDDGLVSREYPALASDPRGGFLVAWESYPGDGDSFGVAGKNVPRDGVPVGSEFQVNGFSVGEQIEPVVAPAGHNRFVVAWTSDGQDGSGEGVFARRMALPAPLCGDNDDIDCATDLTGPKTVFAQNTAAATTADDDPSTCGSGKNSHSVWYRFAPPSSVSMQIDSFGSSYDTVLALWTGEPGALVKLTCKNDTGGTLQTKVLFDAIGGTTYWIEVMSRAATAGGSLVLNVSPTCGKKLATIIGTEGDDALTGTTGKDVIVGLGGNDTVQGLEGSDRLCGDDGNDVLVGADGSDKIYGGNGTDACDGGSGSNTLVGCP